MRDDSAPAITWHKSTYSSNQGQCVEVAGLTTGSRAVRDSKDPAGAVLRFTEAAWSVFTVGVRGGEFD